MNLKQKLQFKKFIRELEAIRGRHTELVSVYVPAGYDLIKVIQHLQQEQGTASNIKDARTRNNVIDSLEKMIRHLRLFKKTPPNGLAVFAGNNSQSENKITINVWSIEPPEPLNFRLYRCEQVFILDPLKQMLEHRVTYGLIVIDKREATIGLLKGSAVEELITLTSGVPGKTKAGGQSAQRFSRIREEMTKEFFKRVAEAASKQFLEMKELKGIIIGGPSPTKEDFFESGYINNEIKKKVIGLKDLSYTGNFGLHELVDKSADLLKQEEVIEEKNAVNKLLEMLRKNPEKVAYGKKEVKYALEAGAVEKLLLSESIPEEEIEEFQDLADVHGAEIQIISVDTREGVQLRDIGGIAAILRYALR